MAFEYRGWFLGFTLSSPNKKGQHWCQLSKSDVVSVLNCHPHLQAAIQHIINLKGVTGVDAEAIYEVLILIREGRLDV